MDADRALEIGRARVRAEAAAVAQTEAAIGTDLVDAATLILESTGKVFPVGLGTSGVVARRLAHLLSVTGTPAAFVHPADGLHGSLGAITAQDVVIAFSKGGQTSELNEFTRRAKARGASVISVTGEADNELADLGDVSVRLPSPQGADPGGVIAMGTTLVAGAWGDALAAVLMDARGYTWSEVLFTHPGGAVGALTEDDVQPGDALAQAATHAGTEDLDA